jgi:hypothetical protein
MPKRLVDDPDALVAALVELDRHVGRDGWDGPPRLFALVLSDVLAAAEPQLSAELAAAAGVQGGRRPCCAPGTTATGAAPGALTAIEQDEFGSSAQHPHRQEIRVVVGADRAGNRHGVARLAAQPEKLLGAPDPVPGLAAALAHTLS